MIVILSGNNSFGLKAELSRLTGEFAGEYSDMAIERIDCEEAEYTKITEVIQSLPFLTNRKLVVLYKPSVQKAFTENLSQIIESIPDSNDLIIVEPNPDKRTSYYKQLKKLAGFMSFDELNEPELIIWIGDYVKARGGKIGASESRYLLQRVGDNQSLLGNELDKLIDYQPDVTRESIDLLVEQPLTSTIFQLMDVAFAGDAKQALRLYKEQRAQKVEPLAIIGLLAWQLHVLALVKTAGDISQPEISKASGINPFVIRKAATTANRIGLSKLKHLVARLAEIDVKLKTSEVDPDEALENYLLELAV